MGDIVTLKEYCIANGKHYAYGRSIVQIIADQGGAERVTDGLPGRGVWRVDADFPWPFGKGGWPKGKRRVKPKP